MINLADFSIYSAPKKNNVSKRLRKGSNLFSFKYNHIPVFEEIFMLLIKKVENCKHSCYSRARLGVLSIERVHI